MNRSALCLTDTSSMPFGKYKGIPMQDVPAKYLHYLWIDLAFKQMFKNKIYTETLNSFDTQRVAEYINESLSALQQDTPDLIW